HSSARVAVQRLRGRWPAIRPARCRRRRRRGGGRRPALSPAVPTVDRSACTTPGGRGIPPGSGFPQGLRGGGAARRELPRYQEENKSTTIGSKEIRVMQDTFLKR